MSEYLGLMSQKEFEFNVVGCGGAYFSKYILSESLNIKVPKDIKCYMVSDDNDKCIIGFQSVTTYVRTSIFDLEPIDSIVFTCDSKHEHINSTENKHCLSQLRDIEMQFSNTLSAVHNSNIQVLEKAIQERGFEIGTEDNIAVYSVNNSEIHNETYLYELFIPYTGVIELGTLEHTTRDYYADRILSDDHSKALAGIITALRVILSYDLGVMDTELSTIKENICSALRIISRKDATFDFDYIVKDNDIYLIIRKTPEGTNFTTISIYHCVKTNDV
jgi:hypothetical protein